MYDTRPDLRSYVLTARRLWWLVAGATLVGVLAAAILPSAMGRSVTGTIQVPDLRALSAVAETGTIFDPVSEAVFLTEDLQAAIDASERKPAIELEARPGRPVVEVSIDASGEAQADEYIEELNSLIAERWPVRAESLLGPAVAFSEAAVTGAEQRLEQLPSTGETAEEIERIRLAEDVLDGKSLLASFDSFLQSTPVLSILSVQASGGTSVITLAAGAAAGAFLGVGLLILATLLDRRVRRRSVLERNGLTVVAVAPSGSGHLDAVPASLLSANQGAVSTAAVVAVGGSDPSPTAAALTEDEGIGSVAVIDSSEADERELIEAVRNAEAVVLVAEAGVARYEELLEVARTAVASGAHNVCSVVVAKNRRALHEART